MGLVNPAVVQADWELFQHDPRGESARGGGVFMVLAGETWLRHQQGSKAGFGPASAA